MAVILTARSQAARPTEPTAGSPLAVDWRRILAELATADDDDHGTAAVGLALEVAVHHPTPSRYVTSTDPRVTHPPDAHGQGGQVGQDRRVVA